MIKNDDWVGLCLGFHEKKMFESMGLAVQIEYKKGTGTHYIEQTMQILDIGARKIYAKPSTNELLTAFSPSTILDTYGQPAQIIIRP